MNQKGIFLLCFLFFGSIQISKAQTFKASLLLGANLSDLYEATGIDTYMGLNAGGKISVHFKKKWAASTGLLLSQQADYLLPRSAPTINFNRIFLNYIEVPLQMEYWYYPTKDGYYRGFVTFGLGYARLVHFVAIGEGDIDLSDEIVFDSPNTYFFHLGAGGFFSEHVGLHFRGALSSYGTWTLALRGIYQI